MIRIVLIDSNKLLRHSMEVLISSFANCEVSADVNCIQELPNDFDHHEVKLIIFDPYSKIPVKIAQLRELFTHAKMIILTNDTNRDSIMKAMQSGVSGYFSKDDCPSQLRKCIHEIDHALDFREIRLGTIIRQKLIEKKPTNLDELTFSKRELEILRLICQEKTNAEISDILGLSIRTVESHRRRMIVKSDSKSIIGVILSIIELENMNIQHILQKGNQAS